MRKLKRYVKPVITEHHLDINISMTLATLPDEGDPDFETEGASRQYQSEIFPDQENLLPDRPKY
jgi:hypothetical protein